MVIENIQSSDAPTSKRVNLNSKFYEIYGDKWKSKELDALIIEAWGFKAKASERGKKGAEARWGKKRDNDDGGEEP